MTAIERQGDTWEVGRSGEVVYVSIPLAGFDVTAEVWRIGALRQKLRERQDIPAGIRIDVYRQLENIEAEYERELFDLQSKQHDQGSLVVLLWLAAATAAIFFFLWGWL